MSVPVLIDYFASNNIGNTTSWNIDSGVYDEGDVLFIAIVSDAAGQVFTEPPGFTILYSDMPIPASSPSATFALFYKVGVPSEPLSYPVSVNTSEKQTWIAFTVRGFKTIIHAQGTTATGSSGTATIPAITTTQSDCLLIGIVGSDGTPSVPYGASSTYTKVVESTATSGGGVALYKSNQPNAGTRAADSVTLATEQWIGVSFAIAGPPSISVNDTVTITESVTLSATGGTPSPSISDTITVIETVAASVVSYPRVTENITLSESAALSSPAILVVISETVTIGEQTNASIPGISASQIVVNDNVTLSEAVTAIIGLSSVSVANSVTLAEQVAATVLSHISTSDSITLTEQLAVSGTMNAVTSDDIVITETATLATGVRVQVSDLVTVTEVVIYSDKLLVNVSETITVTDSVIIPEVPVQPNIRDFRLGSDAANTLNTIVQAPLSLFKDVIFIAITSDAFNQVFTTPEGFSVLYDRTSIGSTATFTMFYKLSSGAEPATYTVGVSLVERQSWVCFSVSSVALPIHIKNTILGGTHDQPAFSSLTTAVDDSLVIGIIATNDYPAPYTNTGSFYAEQYEAGGSSAGSVSIWIGYQRTPDATPEDVVQATLSVPYITAAFALEPLINRLVFPSDTITIGEANSLIVSTPQAQTADTVTITETISLSLVLNVSINEGAITVTDSAQVERFYNITLSDNLTAAEVVATQMAQNIQISVANTVTVSETKSVIPTALPFHAAINDHITVGELVTMIVISGGTIPNPFGFCCGRIRRRGTVVNQ